MLTKTISMSAGQSLAPTLEYLKTLNCPLDKWLLETGLPIALLDDYNIQVPAIAWWRLLELAAEQLQCFDLGVKIDHYDQGKLIMKLFRQAFEQSHSLHDVWMQIIALIRGESSNASLKLVYQQRGAWIQGSGFEMLAKDHPQVEQIVLCHFRHIGRHFIGEHWQPSALKALNTDTHGVLAETFTLANVFDKADCTGMYFSNQQLGTINKHLLNNVAVSALIKQNFSERVYEIMFAFSRYGLPDKDYFERHLGLTARQIRSRLEQEGTTFRQLTNQVKLDMASYYLRQTDQSIIELALMLGYKNSTHFSRAFKSLSGLTPLVFRKQQRQINVHGKRGESL
ncbi:helix-turn-helix domain-containing protein [Thalassotalea psychrophila]|uniref:Helix-turn-helix domain-containing protein n=1 Tax=Thalassotalea psychrophila TaxID=3065647 RepID=A0ABY9TZK8_9GAMM|nr:helix-turn-helix domain-containing protein [Colwelliaceae bacterium SQ149]